ncbi:MAG TPA: holo-ACP synthase [Gemmatimonadales bacterium]|nr:holo-ACP synthase [Gemmatimonadales bacterium]
MILGLGLDVVETAELGRTLAKQGERFEQRVFTAAEIAASAGRVDREQALAARFAAKEACLKALGTGVSEGLSLQQVEVSSADGGSPSINLSGAAADRARARGVRAIHVSLSHQPGLAAAVVILEG